MVAGLLLGSALHLGHLQTRASRRRVSEGSTPLKHLFVEVHCCSEHIICACCSMFRRRASNVVKSPMLTSSSLPHSHVPASIMHGAQAVQPQAQFNPTNSSSSARRIELAHHQTRDSIDHVLTQSTHQVVSELINQFPMSR